jgi:hypothetical protein
VKKVLSPLDREIGGGMLSDIVKRGSCPGARCEQSRRAYMCLRQACRKPTSLADDASRLPLSVELHRSAVGSILRSKAGLSVMSASRK